MASPTCAHDHDEELSEAHDEHDFAGHEHLLSEGTAHICSFYQRGKNGPVRTLAGLYVPENEESSMSIMGVDITSIVPRNCCLGPDSTVFLLKLTEAKSKKVIKMQALSTGSDVLKLTGKYIDFTAEETYLGGVAQSFMNTVVLDSGMLVDPEMQDDVMAWSGILKLAGFKISTITAGVLDLSR